MKLYADTQSLSKRIDRQIERCDELIAKTDTYRRDQLIKEIARRAGNQFTPQYIELMEKKE